MAHHVDSLAHGIRTAGLLSVNVPDGYSGKSDALNLAFREALSHEPGVEAMAWSMDVPGRGEARSSTGIARDSRGPGFNVNLVPFDTRYFDVYGIPLLAGRLREPPPASEAASAMSHADAADTAPKPEALVAVDLAASRALGFAGPQDAIDKVILGDGDFTTVGHDPLRIVAVVPDVRLEDARQAPLPHVFRLSSRAQATLTLKGPRMDQLRAAIARVWPRFYPDDEPEELQTVEESLAVPYRHERRLAQMATVTTAISLLLSAFGVYALAAYTVRRSAREIVVRKLYGAGRARIAGLVAREFAPLLAVATVIGLPLAGWLAHAWIENFTERSSAAFLALPVAVVALAAMAALAAARHAFIAMNMRPTQALRD